MDETTQVSVTNASDGAVLKFTLQEFVDVIKGSLPVLEQPFLKRVAEVCVCACVCARACVRACVRVCECVSVCVCAYAYVYVYEYVCLGTFDS